MDCFFDNIFASWDLNVVRKLNQSNLQRNVNKIIRQFKKIWIQSMLRILILRIYENKYIHHFGKLKFYFYSESTHLHKIQCVLRHATVSILQTLINFFVKINTFSKRKKFKFLKQICIFFFLIQRPTLYETFSGNGSGYLPVRVL